MARSLRLASLVLLTVLAACANEAPKTTGAPPAESHSAPAVAPPPGPSSAAPTSSASAAAREASRPPARAAVFKYTGFAAPESVLWDEENDRYLVSNVNGKAVDTDNNGFISVLSPDGNVVDLKWIQGGKGKVKLDAPKGMAISKGVLYVADIATLRMFDLKSGAPKGEVKVPGATFLNDVAAAPDGKVFVSDSGLKVGAQGFEPTGTDAVHELVRGKLRTVAKGADLGRPNGIAVVGNDSLIVVTFGTNEVYRLDEKGTKSDVTRLPKGSLDGVVALDDGTLLISSWDGSAVYRGKLGGTFDVLLADQKSPADIGYDKKRARVLVPHFNDDTVEVYDIK